MIRWEKAMKYKWQSCSSHTFFLHLNVYDNFLDRKRKNFESLAEHLLSSTIVGDAEVVAFFNRGTGIQFTNDDSESKVLRILEAKFPDGPVPSRLIGEKDIDFAFWVFDILLQISWNMDNEETRPLLEKFAGEAGIDAKIGKPFFAAVWEYAETLFPPDSATTACASDRNAIVRLETWARDRNIRSAKNIIVFVSESVGLVAPQLRSETSGITSIQVEFPDTKERKRTIVASHNLVQESQGQEMPVDRLAHLTAGMTRVEITNLISESSAMEKSLDAERVFWHKKKLIEDRAGGLLHIVNPQLGLESIGGLYEHKRYIEEVIQAMRNNDPLAVPQGILLLGAPGTGKTVFAEALANEASIPFVKMKNIREMWVGQSERNQALALETIRVLAPTVVFIDEIDQQMQPRGMSFDNTGVNNRLQAQLFEFMSDSELRGKVLWIAASNRPDMIDTALLRVGRFDVKIPFFPPSWIERADILRAILRKMKIRYPSFKWEISEDFFEEFGWYSHWHKADEKIERCDADIHPRGKEDTTELPLTGAEIEAIVAVAYGKKANQKSTIFLKSHILEALAEHIPNPDFGIYDKMTELAVMYCASERFIPEGVWRERAKTLRYKTSTQQTKLI